MRDNQPDTSKIAEICGRAMFHQDRDAILGKTFLSISNQQPVSQSVTNTNSNTKSLKHGPNIQHTPHLGINPIIPTEGTYE